MKVIVIPTAEACRLLDSIKAKDARSDPARHLSAPIAEPSTVAQAGAVLSRGRRAIPSRGCATSVREAPPPRARPRARSSGHGCRARTLPQVGELMDDHIVEHTVARGRHQPPAEGELAPADDALPQRRALIADGDRGGLDAEVALTGAHPAVITSRAADHAARPRGPRWGRAPRPEARARRQNAWPVGVVMDDARPPTTVAERDDVDDMLDSAEADRLAPRRGRRSGGPRRSRAAFMREAW